MEELIQLIQQNVHYAHWIIFGALLLAGFNIPVSEDGMIFISAILAAKNPEYLPHLFIGVYLGAYFSDLICYTLGRVLGPRLFEIKMFAKMASPEKIEKVHAFYEKYGIATLLIGRFIPFGVRNALFLTAGLGKMNRFKFAISDLIACTVSTVCFFSLYYHYGVSVVEYVKDGNMILFGVVVVALCIFFVIKKKKARRVDPQI